MTYIPNRLAALFYAVSIDISDGANHSNECNENGGKASEHDQEDVLVVCKGEGSAG